MALTDTFDVVVVGGGSAGFAAAVSASDGGAGRVLVLEKGRPDEVGGNARFSHTGFTFVHDGRDELRRFLPDLPDDEFDRLVIHPYTAEAFHAALQRTTRGTIDPALADVLVSRSNAALHWMSELGFAWETTRGVTIDGRRHFEPGNVINPQGGGIGQITRWLELASSRGIEVRCDARVSSLRGDHRRVAGVTVDGPTGTYEVDAEAVILCSGGFQANPRMRARHLGPNAERMKVRGTRHNTGEVLVAALQLGARAAGQWQGAQAPQIDANAPPVESGSAANRYSYPLGILVNRLGVRFFDEGAFSQGEGHGTSGRAVLDQPGAIAFQIFDQKVTDLLTHQYRLEEALTADSIDALARAIGVSDEVLAHTVSTFNAAVDDRHVFDHTRPDGRSTQGLDPDKSNWALAIDTPPYVAFPVTAGITFTYGGLAIDARARVLDETGTAIEGLYANGDILGLFAHDAPSNSGQTRNVVFGRIAGVQAAAHCARR